MSMCDFISITKKSNTRCLVAGEHSKPSNFTRLRFRSGVYSCKSLHTCGATQRQENGKFVETRKNCENGEFVETRG